MPGGIAKPRLGCSARASNGCSDYVRSRNGWDAVTCTTILVSFWKSSHRKRDFASTLTTVEPVLASRLDPVKIWRALSPLPAPTYLHPRGAYSRRGRGPGKLRKIC